MQNNIIDRSRHLLAIVGLIAGIGLFSIAATGSTTSRQADGIAVSGTVTTGVVSPGGVFGWD